MRGLVQLTKEMHNSEPHNAVELMKGTVEEFERAYKERSVVHNAERVITLCWWVLLSLFLPLSYFFYTCLFYRTWCLVLDFRLIFLSLYGLLILLQLLKGSEDPLAPLPQAEFHDSFVEYKVYRQ
jgi:hypothetical protein